MKTKKQAASRRKLNFAVDREEIEINSDWVQAVMGPARAEPAGLFFGPGANNATDASSSTGEENNTAVELAPAERIATDVEDATGHRLATDEIVTTVELFSTVAKTATRVPRPKPLRRVTDGLTSGQYAVYSLMLENAAPGQGSRVYRGGYADLCRLTGLSKRGIQNVIAGLLDKRAIALSQSPGHHRSQTSVYEVHPPETVLTGWYARGLRFAFGKSKALSSSATVASLATVA